MLSDSLFLTKSFGIIIFIIFKYCGILMQSFGTFYATAQSLLAVTPCPALQALITG